MNSILSPNLILCIVIAVVIVIVYELILRATKSRTPVAHDLMVDEYDAIVKKIESAQDWDAIKELENEVSDFGLNNHDQIGGEKRGDDLRSIWSAKQNNILSYLAHPERKPLKSLK